jgi:hypothetical protein
MDMPRHAVLYFAARSIGDAAHQVVLCTGLRAQHRNVVKIECLINPHIYFVAVTDEDEVDVG